MKQTDPTVDWLLEGDPAIRWQVFRDLTGAPERTWRAERRRVAKEGWGARLLALQRPDGNWGRGLYQPKWTCTTYTLLLLRRCGLEPGYPAALKACRLFLDHGLWKDGGINLSRTIKQSETCITGMVVAVGSYFGLDDPRLEEPVGYLLAEQMPDGGWNCQRWRGATHSSFHTTINVLEGLREYALTGGRRARETEAAEARAREFLLVHRLYRSHRTGRVVDAKMLGLPFPPQWHHDVLRALEYFAWAGAPRDARLEDPMAALLARRRDGTWPLHRGYPGAVHFPMEAAGAPSRWTTLRALRVLSWWGAGAPTGSPAG